MISKPVLKRLVKRYLTDAQILFANRRYATAVYIAGYAVELAFKYKICRFMKFGKGFPENDTDFSKYLKNIRRIYPRQTMLRLKDIRHHNLERLLEHSGEKLNVENNYSRDWGKLKTWQPSSRYFYLIIRQATATDFIHSARSISSLLIK